MPPLPQATPAATPATHAAGSLLGRPMLEYLRSLDLPPHAAGSLLGRPMFQAHRTTAAPRECCLTRLRRRFSGPAPATLATPTFTPPSSTASGQCITRFQYMVLPTMVDLAEKEVYRVIEEDWWPFLKILADFLCAVMQPSTLLNFL